MMKGGARMIALQKLNGNQFVLNSDLIESIESTPDTVIVLTNGKKIIVSNPIEDIVRKTVRYKQLCSLPLQADGKRPGTDAGGNK
jgi:flagellar protein FlbD